MNTATEERASVETPRHIHAAVGPKVLSRAAELFDQRLDTVLGELLQNSRRAGARNVRITVTPCGDKRSAIAIADDGCGIDVPEKLITFGDSDWDLETDEVERAAGMGFYSLASRGCEVQSLDWKAAISPRAFIGQEPVLVRSAERINGTVVSFDTDVAADSVRGTIRGAVKYYPFAVTLNGEDLPQADFLADALRVREAYGVRIGVFFREDSHRSESPALNFHGLAIAGPTRPTVRYVGARGHFTIKLDVIDARGFKLVLPARQAVIEDEYVAKVMGVAKLAILEHCASDPNHRLAYRDFSAAKASGITVNPPQIELTAWYTFGADENCLDSLYLWKSLTISMTNASRVVLIDKDFDEKQGRVNLHRALSRMSEGQGLLAVCAEPHYEGYQQYDALKKLDGVRWQITVGGVACEFDPEGDIPEELQKSCIAEALAIVLALQSAKGRTTDELPTDILAINADYEEPCDAWMYALAGISPDDVTDHLMNAYFSYNDDGDADSSERQREEAYDRTHEAVLGLLCSERDADIYRALEAAKELRWALNRSIARVEVSSGGVALHFSDGTIEARPSGRFADENETSLPPAIVVTTDGDGPVFAAEAAGGFAFRSEEELVQGLLAIGCEPRTFQVHLYDTGAERDRAADTLASVCSVEQQRVNLGTMFALIVTIPNGDGKLCYVRHQQFAETSG